MKIIVNFSIHAKEKMQSRGVKASDVLSAIKEPDSVYNDVEHGTLVSIKKIKGNSIIVAYKMENDGAKAITLFHTTKLDTTKLDKLMRAKTARGAWKKQK